MKMVGDGPTVCVTGSKPLSPAENPPGQQKYVVASDPELAMLTVLAEVDAASARVVTTTNTVKLVPMIQF